MHTGCFQGVCLKGWFTKKWELTHYLLTAAAIASSCETKSDSYCSSNQEEDNMGRLG